MGYYTYYDGIAYDKDFNQIDFEDPNSTTLDIIKTLANFMHDEYPCDTIEELSDVIIEIFTNGSGDLKWYDYEDHMKKLAECFPDYKFEIEGFGEERGDWWVHDFHGNKDIKSYCSPPKSNILNI